MNTEKEEKRVIAIYDKQLGHYTKSVPLELSLGTLTLVLKQYVDDPLSYSYKITPEMSNLLKKYITMEFDYNRFDYTMEAKVIRAIEFFDNKTDEYVKDIPLKIDLDILNKLFTQYEDDPLFYYGYEVTPELVNKLNLYIEDKDKFDFDFDKFSYVINAYSEY